MKKPKTTADYKVRVNKLLKLILYITLFTVVLCIFLICIFSNAILSVILTAIEGLCISYVAGYIVYYLTVIVDLKAKEEKALHRSISTLSSIYSEMSKIIESIKVLADITDDNVNITKDRLTVIDTMFVPQNDVFIYTDTYTDGIKGKDESFYDYFNYINDLKKYKDTICKNIEKLKIDFFNLPIKLVDTLLNIENSEIYSSIRVAVYSSSYAPTITNQDFSTILFDYIQLYNNLSLFGFTKVEYKCKKMSDEDINKYTEIRASIRKQIPAYDDDVPIFDSYYKTNGRWTRI